MQVVKFGGSLLGRFDMEDWLACLHKATGRGLVIVPGGGIFAEQVRLSQQAMGYTEQTAHRMAILGMQQYGLMLGDLLPNAVRVDHIAALRATVRAGQSAIWLPVRMLDELDNAPGLKAGWSCTADSLGLWLAAQLQAQRYALIKAVPLPTLEGHRWEDYAARSDTPAGLVDEGFAGLRRGYAGSVHVFGCGHQDEFLHIMAAE